MSIALIAYPAGVPPGACGEPGPLGPVVPAVFLDISTGSGPVTAGRYPITSAGNNPSQPADGGPVAGLELEGVNISPGYLGGVSGSVSLTEVCGTVAGTFEAGLGGDGGTLSGTFSAPYCPSGE